MVFESYKPSIVRDLDPLGSSPPSPQPCQDAQGISSIDAAVSLLHMRCLFFDGQQFVSAMGNGKSVYVCMSAYIHIYICIHMGVYVYAHVQICIH